MEQSLRNRLTFGPLMIAGLGALLWLDHAAQGWTRSDRLPAGVGGIGLLALLMIILPLATIELAALLAAEQVRPQRLTAGIGAGSLVIHAFLTQFEMFRPISASTLMLVVVSIMIIAALRRAALRQTEDAIHLMAGTVFSSLYLGGLGWFLVALRVKHSGHVHGTTLTILMILAMVKSTDIGAYFGGRAFGKHKLIPWLSPKKTWEGLACGLLTAGAIGAMFSPFIAAPIYALPWWKGVIFGVVIGGIGQAGDLLESMMKRDADVKDSSSLIPGFGGVLDVIDSPLLAAPCAYLLFSLL